MVLAHPDDEIIFGWPVFQNENIEKKVLICSSDFYNQERQWCKYRKEALFEVCRKVGADVTCLDYPSGFYKVPTRRPPEHPPTEFGDSHSPVRRLYRHIVKNILTLEKDCDAVFTHNPFGEYGHLDHKMLFDLVIKNSTKDVIITDIVLSSNWSEKPEFTERLKRIYYSDKIETGCSLDNSLLEFCKREYEKKNGWTWNRPIQKECSLYRIGS